MAWGKVMVYVRSTERWPYSMPTWCAQGSRRLLDLRNQNAKRGVRKAPRSVWKCVVSIRPYGHARGQLGDSVCIRGMVRVSLPPPE
jgi:hypothetical protein